MITTLFDRIAIIGLGLIGGSIARAARERGLTSHVVGCDPNDISLAFARKKGWIDEATHDLKIAVTGADLVIIAAPPTTLEEIARAIAPGLKPDAVVMDTCSVKRAAIDAIAPNIPAGVAFMPAHPIAGGEQSGIKAAKADLFARKLVIVTPDQPGGSETLKRITSFWKGMGARLEAMPPHIHDLVYAYVSHLPHLLAFAAAPLLPNEDKNLKNFLRLTEANPALWSEICALNKDNVINSLDKYLDVISHVRSELAQAPDEEETDDASATAVLFPRIAASCLITTVMAAEKQAGFPFARYAGNGFADFVSPAADGEPESDIERISGASRAVAAALDEFKARLVALRTALSEGDAAEFESSLRQ